MDLDLYFKNRICYGLWRLCKEIKDSDPSLVRCVELFREAIVANKSSSLKIPLHPHLVPVLREAVDAISPFPDAPTLIRDGATPSRRRHTDGQITYHAGDYLNPSLSHGTTSGRHLSEGRCPFNTEPICKSESPPSTHQLADATTASSNDCDSVFGEACSSVTSIDVIRNRRIVNIAMKTHLQMDKILMRKWFNYDLVVAALLAASIRRCISASKRKELHDIMFDFVSVIPMNCRQHSSVSNKIWECLFNEAMWVTDSSSISLTCRIFISLALRFVVNCTATLFTLFIPEYVNNRVFGISPALLAAFTMAKIPYEKMIKCMDKMNDRDKDVFTAMFMLIRSGKKDLCTLRTRRVGCLAKKDARVIASTCVEVLKDNLSQMDFMLALIAISISHCSQSVDTADMSTELNSMTLRILQREAASAMREGNGGVREAIRRIRGQIVEAPKLMGAVFRYLMASVNINTSVRRVVMSNATLCDLNSDFASKLLMFAISVSFCGNALLFVVKQFWKIITCDRMSFVTCFRENNVEMLKHIEKVCKKQFRTFSHLHIMLTVLNEMPNDCIIPQVYEKVDCACFVTLKSAKGKLDIVRTFQFPNPHVAAHVRILKERLEEDAHREDKLQKKIGV